MPTRKAMDGAGKGAQVDPEVETTPVAMTVVPCLCAVLQSLARAMGGSDTPVEEWDRVEGRSVAGAKSGDTRWQINLQPRRSSATSGGKRCYYTVYTVPYAGRIHSLKRINES